MDFLPRGAVVPVDQVLRAPPAPFDPARDQLLPNTRPERNLALGGPSIVRRLPADRLSGAGPVTALAATPPTSPDDANAYIGLDQATRPWYGVYSVHDALTSLDLTIGGTTSAQLYAPTLLAPGGACLEIVTWHLLEYGSPVTRHRQAWADWCADTAGSMAVEEDMTDPAFGRDYIRTYLGRPTVAVSVVTPNTGHTNGQCWYGSIYNYRLGGWEQKAVSCGVTRISSGVTGWSAWEGYGFAMPGVCPAFPSIRAMNLQFADPLTSAWVPISGFPYDVRPPVALGSCLQGNWKFRYPGSTVGLPVNSWKLITDMFQ